MVNGDLVQCAKRYVNREKNREGRRVEERGERQESQTDKQTDRQERQREKAREVNYYIMQTGEEISFLYGVDVFQSCAWEVESEEQFEYLKKLVNMDGKSK